MPYTFLITGASSGFGLELSLAALAAGHAVLAAARNPAAAAAQHPEVASRGGTWLTLDVADPGATATVARVAAERRVNVVINNAGYSLLGAVEDLSEAQMKAQMETNLYGALRVIQGALPTLRQAGGTIVNISSTSGLDGLPACGMYSASKFALEGVSESLSRELAPFNIRVLIVEPGAFRTNFLRPGVFDRPTHRLSPAYAGTPAEKVLDALGAADRRQPSDAAKGARAMVEVITGTGRGAGLGGVLRLPLGKDAVGRTRGKLEGWRGDLERTEGLAVDMDCED